MKAVKIKDNVYFVGAIDYKLRLFHGYSTEKGSTYNAFLIIDDEITLIDTVKNEFFDEMLERLSSVIDPKDIKHIICNHVEPDHSGALNKLLQIAPHASVYASSPSGISGLKKYYGNIDIKPLKTGDILKIGKTTLSFIQTPMVHWPDNMLTYHNETEILFSNDAFGQHYAVNKCFDDEVDLNEAIIQAKKYYANIVLPYGAQVGKALSASSNLKISVIAPSHGVLWRKHIDKILQVYNSFVDEKSENSAVIVYDTMWKSTEKMAYVVQDAFAEVGMSTDMMDLQNNHISNIITAVAEKKYLAIGSPTLNNGMLPSVAAFLCYLKGLAPKNKHFLAFGSYGWGGQSIPQIHDQLISCGFSPICDPQKIQYKPSIEELAKLKENIINVLK